MAMASVVLLPPTATTDKRGRVVPTNTVDLHQRAMEIPHKNAVLSQTSNLVCG